MKAAEDFIYNVNNYHSHKANNIDNFRLVKRSFYYDEKYDYRIIESSVNVTKNYQNVFLTENNYHSVVNIIKEWKKIKSSNWNREFLIN